MTLKSSAEARLRQGDLGGALIDLQNCVRDDPADASLRIFLFQLLAVRGDWDRALTQLNVVSEMNAETLLMAQTYRELLLCEVYRQNVYAGKRAPLFLGDPPAWVAGLIQALALSARGDGEGARALVDESFAKIEPRGGLIDDVRFEWIADADMRLGPIVEAIINGRFYWVPFDNIASMNISTPDDLRDLVWTPVEFTWKNGGDVVGFVPSRYPGEATLADDSLALGRATQWTDLGAEFYIGHGQRVLSTDSDDYSLLQSRCIVFDDSTSS